MSESPRDISRATLERLVARALELDESRSDRVSLTKAREVARDLGISAMAWQAALAEHEPLSMARAAPINRWRQLRTMMIAGLGFAAGAVGGWVNAEFNGDLDVVYAVVLVVGGVFLSARAHKESPEAAQTSLDAWWVAIPAGMLAAFGGLRTDPLLFAAIARWGSGWAITHLPRLSRFLLGLQRHAVR